MKLFILGIFLLSGSAIARETFTLELEGNVTLRRENSQNYPNHRGTIGMKISLKEGIQPATFNPKRGDTYCDLSVFNTGSVHSLPDQMEYVIPAGTKITVQEGKLGDNHYYHVEKPADLKRNDFLMLFCKGSARGLNEIWRGHDFSYKASFKNVKTLLKKLND
jgi:hypothetical protein